MPITRVDYVPLPAVVPRRVADTRTLGALLQRQGENSLQYELAKGQSAAQMWQQLGRLFSSYAQGTREDQTKAALLEERKQEQLRADQLKRDEYNDRKAEREEAQRLRTDAEKRRLAEEAAKVGDAVAESVGYGAMSEPQMEQVLKSPVQAARARYSFGPGTAEGPELLPTRDQQEDIDWRKAVEAKGGMVGPKGQAVMPPAPKAEPNPTEVSLAMMAANGDRGAIRALEILNKQKNAGKVPPAPRAPIWVVDANGEFKDLAGVAPPGSKPANTREQGRAVTSGDAGRIADLDTSLNDLVTLRGAVTDPGTITRIQASLPTWVSELTGGWTDDAKAQNAVIARVRQVIGKALEGGVLRKEDEEKYKAILPVIGDPKQVAMDKIAGLETALKQRRQTTLDALSDAGYDISKFAARTPAVTAVPDLAGLQKGRGRRFSDGPFAGQTWTLGADGKPQRVQ